MTAEITADHLDAAVDAARVELEAALQECIRLKPSGEAFIPLRPGKGRDLAADGSPYGDARRRAAAASLAADAAIDRRSAWRP